MEYNEYALLFISYIKGEFSIVLWMNQSKVKNEEVSFILVIVV